MQLGKSGRIGLEDEQQKQLETLSLDSMTHHALRKGQYGPTGDGLDHPNFSPC